MTQDAENDRVRGYPSRAIRPPRLGPPSGPRVVEPRVELRTEIARVSQEQAAFAPSPDDWSIRKCVPHVLRAAHSTLARIEALAAGREDAPQPAAVEAGSLEELRTVLAADSSHYAGLLERLSAEPNLELTAEHCVLGALNSRAWFLFQRLHDSDHLGQIRAVKEAPGYPEA